MKKQIRTSRVQYILVSVLIALVGLGTWISCSKDSTVSSMEDPQPRASKPALPASPDFYPQTNVNYDPFAGMSFADRKAAIGGMDGAMKYLQVVARQLVYVMNDEKARNILHRVVPKSDEGEIHLAQVLTDHPEILTSLSSGFKGAVSDKAIGDDLSEIIRDTDTNGEAVLKASKALFDLMISVATPDRQAWDSATETIPVFYVPKDDDIGDTMTGISTDLNPVTFTIGSKIPYPFLYLNFDENSSMMDGNDVSLSFESHIATPWEKLWAS